MRDDGNAIFAFHHLVGFSEGIVHVALVFLRRFVPGQRRICVHDLMVERFVLDFDKPRSFFGDFLRHRRDRRDDFSRVAHFLLRVAPNALHAGQRFGSAGVDARDLRVRVR